MAKFIFALIFAVVAVANARMAYQFAADIPSILRERSFRETFSCEGRAYGYYADDDNNCEIFHVCLPIPDDSGAIIETAHFSFACGNQTVFSQDSLTCSHPEEAFPCDQARALYDLSNSEFGIIPLEKK